ncbi:MAG TPA: carboxypeptidase regulatory-like domain-containing protein, partial [Planctomycetes bacterium]|nr:carboxypeptidase regulatory-like domain-containing protein [Planctomycetota bacterium]
MNGGRWAALGALLLGVVLVLALLGPGGSSYPLPLPEPPSLPGSGPASRRAPRALGGPAVVEALVEVRKVADPAGPLPLPAFFAGGRVPREGALRGADEWGRPWAGRAGLVFLEGPCRGLNVSLGPGERLEGLPVGWSLARVSLPGWEPFLRLARLRRGVTWPLSLPSGAPCVVKGKVFGPAGKPLEGALVRVDGKEARTKKDGSFLIQGVAPGECLFLISAPGCATSLFPCTVAGGAVKPLVFVLKRGAVLRGRVLFPGRPVAGVRVRLFPGGLGNRLCRYAFGVEGWTKAGPQGEFTIQGVPLETPLRVWAEG